MPTDTGNAIVNYITERLGKSPDFVSHEFKVHSDLSFTCLYISTMVSTEHIEEVLLKPLMERSLDEEAIADPIDWLKSFLPQSAIQGRLHLLRGRSQSA